MPINGENGAALMNEMDKIVVENGVEVIYRYKYLPFNDGSLKMISDGTIKFTCPLEFNDPFDCMPAYDPDSIANIHKSRPDLIRKAGDSMGLSPAKRLMHKGVFIKNIADAVNSGDFAKASISNVSAFCVSRTPCNTLMWSHYADFHQGFVVELRIPMDAPHELLKNMIPHEVSYTEERPVIDWGRTHPDDIQKYYFTKSIDWKYEQEERVINPGQIADIYPYAREHFLCSVIAGAKITNPNYAILSAVVASASRDIGKIIPLRRANLAKQTYKVYVPGHPNPYVST